MTNVLGTTDLTLIQDGRELTPSTVDVLGTTDLTLIQDQRRDNQGNMMCTRNY